jgi:hypothetical protein
MPRNVRSSTVVQVKRAAYQQMEKLAFDRAGTIFGGYVRDKIIFKHYTDEFHNNMLETDKYWDKTYSPETRSRLLIPTDMDVAFKTMEDADNFISDLREVRQYSDVHVVDTLLHSHYYAPIIQSVRKVTMRIIIGEIPFVHRGLTVVISADVVVAKPNIIMQPPFGNLDMLCNGFIMTREHGIIFSKNTGTIIDEYPDLKRTKVICGIMEDLVKFRTYLSFTVRKNNAIIKQKLNATALKRITKMDNKSHQRWTMLNLPFQIDTYTAYPQQAAQPSEATETCAICIGELNEGDRIAYTTNTKEDGTCIPCAKMHHRCFITNLFYQARDESLYEAQDYTFRCPYRSTIDFGKCQQDIESVYV